jgi:glyoxylase I family protein
MKSITKGNIKGMSPLIMVLDMGRSLHFYCDLLGFELIQSAGPADDRGWAHLKLGETELMLNTMYEKDNRPEQVDQERQQHHSDTVFYFGCLDVKKLFQELTEKGLTIKQPYTTGYGWTAIDLHDPDGYGLCFQWPE